MPTPARNPPLFPPFVAQHSVAFDLADPTELAAQYPGVELPASLERAAHKRQHEYLAGRFCARAALRIVAAERADFPVASGPDRAPCWPDGVVGSITHTDRFASAAVARRADAHGIGIDAEHPMSEEQAESVLDTIAARHEIAALARATGWATNRVLTLVFSAKETIFKCLYPEVLHYFDFREASVVSIDPARGVFGARLLVDLTSSLRAGDPLEGRYADEGGLVVTAMVRAP